MKKQEREDARNRQWAREEALRLAAAVLKKNTPARVILDYAVEFIGFILED